MKRPLILIGLAIHAAAAAEPENKYPDLTPEAQHIADADNAWIALKALPAFQLGDVTEERWKEATRFPVQHGKAQPFLPDAELIRKIAAENAELLEKVSSSQKLPAFQIATMEPGVQDTLSKDFNPWVQAWNLNGLLATVEASEG